MKILHTADWHLGKRLDGFSRLGEQIDAMNEIVEIANQHNVDMVLIAGDLFDAFNPNVEAVELFYKTLKQLANNAKRPVIAIGGNHDSPDRINAPDPLARACGIVLIGYPNEEVPLFTLDHFKVEKTAPGFIEIHIKDIDFPVRIIHTAYANEVRLKQYFGEEKAQQLNEVLRTKWALLADEFCDDAGVNILLTHLYMNKRGTALLEEPEGEKPIQIGAADLVFTDCIPPQIHYTALGHLHAFNNIGSAANPVVYASSPLCYSFSEAGQQKYVSIIDIEPNKNATFTPIPLTTGKALVRKKFSSVPQAIAWLMVHPNTLVEITIESNTFLTTDERKALYQAHSGIVHLIPKVTGDVAISSATQQINLNQNINGLFKDYFKSKNANQEPNQEVLDLFNQVLND